MTFEVPFDPAVTTAKYELRYKLASAKNVRKSIGTIILGVVVLGVAAVWFLADDFFRDIYFSLGLLAIFTGTMYFTQNGKRRNRFREMVRKMADLRVRNKDIAIYEFEQDYFRSKDILYDYSLRWAAFRDYQVVKGHLFLRMTESIDDQSFVLSADELGPEGFKAAVEFVDTKLRPTAGS